jgi:hypothetical protein
MNRGYLVLGAAVVLAIVIGLYVGLNRSERVGSTPADAVAKPTPAGEKTTGTAPVSPTVAVTQTATSRSAPPALPASSDPGVSEYTVGGVRIRDHRSGERVPVDIPPTIHPPGGRKIPSQLSSDIAQRLRGVLAECAASVPPEARGATSRLEGQVLIAIKNQQATVTGATYQARDVASAAQGPIKQCMEQKSVGVTTPSGEEPDVEGYGIVLSLRLP